jgi:FAD:protein FMN transferase
MKFLTWRIASVMMVVCLVSATPYRNPEAGVYVSSFENVLGTSFDLKVWTADEQLAELAEQTALLEIDRLNAILSSYDPTSEFSRWMGTQYQDIKISKDLFSVLEAFDAWREKTNGVLDPAAGKILALWKEASLQQKAPDVSMLASAVQEVAQQHWTLDQQAQTAKHLTRTPLVMNSFVKSFIIESALNKVMEIPGISSALVNIGGDIMIKGKETERISIANPAADNAPALAEINVQNRAIATSGNYKRGFRIYDHWYSHIVDPRTGLPADKIVSATVIAPDAAVAGALATAFNVMDPAASEQLAQQQEGVEYLLVTQTGEQIRSEGWSKMEIGRISKSIPVSTQKSWNNGYELAINLELMKFEGRSRRPFVAIWVEDNNKKTVKTLALWFNKPRWLPDLKEWFRKNSDTYQNGSKDVFSIGTATRPAGSYAIKWDGKNEEGVLVPEGNYTVYIEVVREHGTYQLTKQEVSCKNKPQQFTLKHNEEVASASVEYKKTTN